MTWPSFRFHCKKGCRKKLLRDCFFVLVSPTNFGRGFFYIYLAMCGSSKKKGKGIYIEDWQG